MSIRIIPRLDIKGPNLVKGIHLEGLRVLGRPERFARHYYERGADELFFQDTVASLYGRNHLAEIISRTASEIFVPLTVGGGVRTLADMRAILNAGADKVAVNTAAIADPELIRAASRRFGSSTVVVAIEAIRQADGTWRAYTDCGREPTGLNALEWAKKSVELGAGEILLTSVDREGTGKGFDLELVRTIAAAVPVPVVAHGGAGKWEDVADVILNGFADAVAVASILHYECAERFALNEADYAEEGNLEFSRNFRVPKQIVPMDIYDLKSRLSESDITCRVELGVGNER